MSLFFLKLTLNNISQLTNWQLTEFLNNGCPYLLTKMYLPDLESEIKRQPNTTYLTIITTTKFQTMNHFEIMKQYIWSLNFEVRNRGEHFKLQYEHFKKHRIS